MSLANHHQKTVWYPKKILRNERKASKNYSKVMYGHSKWSPHNFELDFGSIQTNFLTKGLQKHFFSSPLKYAIFENYFFVFLDRYKCRANHDMKSSIPLCSKICKTKFRNLWRPYMGCKLYLKDIFKKYKTNCPFRFR